jgi:hypothetical protein
VHWSSSEPEEPEGDYSAGLEYSLNEDEQSYSVTGFGTCRDVDIVIPDTHEGLPVTRIDDNAFELDIGDDDIINIESITIPNSVTSIGRYAIYN